jgi:hypothetical protein
MAFTKAFAPSMGGLLCACCLAGAAAANTPEPLQSLFVKSDAGIDKEVHFLLMKEQKDFDRFFGHAAVMWQKKKLPPPDFTKQIVVAAIHQGKFYTEYKVQSVTNANNVTTITYTTTTKPTPTTTYACPMILTLPREGLATVIFFENGKPVASLKL